MIVNTFTAGDYKAEVYADLTVRVYYKDSLIDHPGPWGDMDGAAGWAEVIVSKYSVDGHIQVGDE